MNSMVDYLNMNQGFVMSVLTCVYVIATVIIVLYTRKSIQEIKLNREEENRPYIFIHLHKDPRDKWFSLNIKNYGRTGGMIKSIQVSPKFKYLGGREIEGFINNTIIAPGQLIQCGVLTDKEEVYRTEYKVAIEYTTSYISKTSYFEEYNLTTQYASQMAYSENKQSGYSQEANELKNIAGYLDSIRNKI